MALLYTSRRITRHALAYVAGLIAADGSLEIRDPFITLPSANRDFLEQHARRYLETVAGRRIRSFVDKYAKVYKLRIYNRALWRTLIERYNVPAGAKSRIVKPPFTLTPREEIAYVQGWFDGEGWLEVLRVRSKTLHEYPRIGFKVRSKSIRDWIVEVIRKKGVRVSSYDRKDDTFGLWINGLKACELFRHRIGFGYPRKNEALKQLVTKCRGQVST